LISNTVRTFVKAPSDTSEEIKIKLKVNNVFNTDYRELRVKCHYGETSDNYHQS